MTPFPDGSNRSWRSLWLLLLLASSGCPPDDAPAHPEGERSGGGEHEEEDGPPSDPAAYARVARKAYEDALADLRDGDCLNALPAFRRLRRKFVYSRFAALAELRIGDCLLKTGRQSEAISAYRRFVRLHPAHEQVPYARFKIAQAHFERIPEAWLLSPPAHERDPRPTREALRVLRRFVQDYPETEFTPEAREMLGQVLRILARHELYAARFYRKRGALQGALGRLNTLIDLYKGSGLEPQALLEKAELLHEMGKEAEARATLQELLDAHGDSPQAEEARARLAH